MKRRAPRLCRIKLYGVGRHTPVLFPPICVNSQAACLFSSDGLGGEQGEKTSAGADIGNDVAPVDPEEIEELLRLLAFVSFRPVKPSGIPRIDQLSLALDAERGRLCCQIQLEVRKAAAAVTGH